MGVAKGTQHAVRALQPATLNAFLASFKPSRLRRALRFGMRVVRSVAFRTRSLLNGEKIRLLRRNLLFPLRNRLFRGRPLTLHAGGSPFLLAPEGAIPLEIWSKRYFEKHELDFILRTLQPGMTFVDIGANVGLFSIPAAMRVQHGKVIAFEPSAWTIERLAKNARLNGVSNLTTVHSAVGDYVGHAALQLNAPGKDGLNTIGNPVHEDSEIIGTEKVPVTTLDDFLSRRSISNVDVMKVDVEGAELMVFRGAKNLLARPAAPLILYESGCLARGFHYHPVETAWFLQGHGYGIFLLDSATTRITRLSGLQPHDCTLIAAKPSHPSYTSLQESAR